MTIVITSKHDGFRRCGIAHSSTAARYPDDFFSEAQLRALSKEPQLILAYEEDEFDQVQDRRDESFQEVDVSKAPGTTQNHQSQTFEANATALGDGVVLPVASVAGNLDSLGTMPSWKTGRVQWPLSQQRLTQHLTPSGATRSRKIRRVKTPRRRHRNRQPKPENPRRPRLRAKVNEPLTAVRHSTSDSLRRP